MSCVTKASLRPIGNDPQPKIASLFGQRLLSFVELFRNVFQNFFPFFFQSSSSAFIPQRFIINRVSNRYLDPEAVF
jgi:hypothetical protein